MSQRRAHRTLSAAIGLRAHSGWAAAVAVALEGDEPRVLVRARLELSARSRKGPVQPYHAAEPMAVDQARRYLDRCRAEARSWAVRGLAGVVRELPALGAKPSSCAILAASGRPLPELSAILASHALIHTADGEHFRDALAGAARSLGLRVVRVREKGLYSTASAVLSQSEENLRARLGELGRAVGPPWTADQKLAALAAWQALA
jgi:hypothetical protein